MGSGVNGSAVLSPTVSNTTTSGVSTTPGSSSVRRTGNYDDASPTEVLRAEGVLTDQWGDDNISNNDNGNGNGHEAVPMVVEMASATDHILSSHAAMASAKRPRGQSREFHDAQDYAAAAGQWEGNASKRG